ncbi:MULTISPECIES: acetyl-CoA carboxylase biotin carboxylase subunit family protein [unclassified Adlercreutzia]|uniref:ATP-grasp domain-containing protein n=1 Tax=unclassified Adlercreutzia TaxID=2636013 RepID=UPI0013EDE2D0|nr:MULTISPECIES: ATP-grasp domain-containing protein [unclassified Adlercreutzia]
MKKALVLAGGLPQIRLIEDLRSRGYRVILADYYESPVARSHADVFYQESTLDVEAMRKIAVDEGVGLIATCCTDQALATVSLLSEELGMPCYVDSRTGLAVTNKALMKKVFSENGIPTARYKTIRPDEDPASFGYPAVVKPVDCNSSKGVRKVASDEELARAIAEAKLLSRTGEAIVEEYVEGEELSADCFVCDGVAHVLCVSRNDKIGSRDGFVISRGFCSPEVRGRHREDVGRIAQAIAEAFSLGDGPMLVQLLSSDEGLSVIEFSARAGGCTKYRVIELAMGFDVIKATVDVILGLRPDMSVFDSGKLVVDEFVYCSSGTFERLEGFDECEERGLIDGAYLLKWRGTAFDGSVGSSGDRVASVVFVADDFEDYRRKHDAVWGSCRVTDSDGGDMARRDLLEYGDIAEARRGRHG